MFDDAPYGVVHALLAHTRAEILLVAEQRAALAQPGAVRIRSCTPRDGDGLTVVELGRAGRRWFRIGASADGAARRRAGGRRGAQILWRCSSFLPMTMRWISEVPSPISSSGASR